MTGGQTAHQPEGYRARYGTAIQAIYIAAISSRTSCRYSSVILALRRGAGPDLNGGISTRPARSQGATQSCSFGSRFLRQAVTRSPLPLQGELPKAEGGPVPLTRPLCNQPSLHYLMRTDPGSAKLAHRQRYNRCSGSREIPASERGNDRDVQSRYITRTGPYRSLTGSGKSPSLAASIICLASAGISTPIWSNRSSAQRPICRGSR